MSPRLAFAIDAAYKGGRSTLALFQAGAHVMTKSDQTPVTLADQGAERLIRELIAETYPGEHILGEEEGGATGEKSRWVIDPIDGTKSFISGVPLYSTLVSYEDHGEVDVAVCYFPALDEMLYAERGQGAFFNGRPARVSTRDTVKGSVICCGGLRSMQTAGRWEPFSRIVDRALATRTWSDAYGHALVATGRVEAMLDPVVAHWDISAVSLLVREAGGRFTDFAGCDKMALDGISSNGCVHQEILDEFNP